MIIYFNLKLDLKIHVYLSNICFFNNKKKNIRVSHPAVWTVLWFKIGKCRCVGMNSHTLLNIYLQIFMWLSSALICAKMDFCLKRNIQWRNENSLIWNVWPERKNGKKKSIFIILPFPRRFRLHEVGWNVLRLKCKAIVLAIKDNCSFFMKNVFHYVFLVVHWECLHSYDKIRCMCTFVFFC